MSTTPTATPFRCAAAAVARGDDLAGTATHLGGFLLVEHDGPWGQTALRDARMPEPVREHLAAVRGLRVLLCRRHDRADRGGSTRVLGCVPRRGLMVRRDVDTLADVVDLDLAAVARGEHPDGWETHPDPVYGVCTHGRHDACCAELGRPVAAALTAARPDQTWEVSHLGGDRFAGNVLVLPQGLSYGRVTPDGAAALADAHDAGRLDLPHLRGRSTRPMPLQYAEIALRRHLDDDRRGSVRLVARDDAEGLTEWTHGPDRWRVRVSRATGAPDRLTCGATRPGPVPSWALDELTRLP